MSTYLQKIHALDPKHPAENKAKGGTTIGQAMKEALAKKRAVK